MARKPRSQDDGKHHGRVVMKRWLRWNLEGKGKSWSSSRQAAYWYRGVFLYCGLEGMARLLKAPDGKLVLFYNEQRFRMWKFISVAHTVLSKERCVAVPSVLISGPGPLMAASDRMFLDDLRVQLLSMGDFYAEQAVRAEIRDQENMAVGNWDRVPWMTRIRLYAQIYDDINRRFEMRWQKYPTKLIEDRLRANAKQRVEHYNSPERVRQRERYHARKAAAEALVGRAA